MTHTRRTFYMLRHGQTEDNARQLVSSNRTPLTAAGREQAVAQRPLFDALFPDKSQCHIISSALPRAVETTELATGQCPDTKDPLFNEINNGRMGGKVSVGFVNKMLKEGEHDVIRNTIKKHKAERPIKHVERSVLGFIRHIGDIDRAGQTPVIVSHHLTMVNIAEALGLPGCKFKNAGLYRFSFDEQSEKWNVAEMMLREGQVVAIPIAQPAASLKK